jgi:tripartite ATP-independent transporter DctP family solute receptor
MYELKKLVSLGLVAAGALAAASAATIAQAQERTIRASLVVSKEHSLGVGLTSFAQCVGQKSGGKLKVQTFFDGSLGADAAVLQQLRTGSVDILVTATSYMATVAPAAGVFDLPFLFADEKEADGVLDGKTGELVAQKMQAAGVISLAYWENGFRNVTNSRKPIQRMEDLQNLKLRVLPTPVMISAFKAMGAFAVPMPFTELYSALETKTVDGQENPTNLIESAKFYEVQKYLSVTRHSYNPGTIMYSKRLFDQLPAADQGVMRDCARAATTEQRRVSREQVEAASTRLKERGMQINVVPDAELRRMREATAPVSEAQWSTLGLDVKAALEDDLRRIRSR